MVAFSPLSLTPLLDGASRPIVAATIEIFDAGTLTPKLAYKDAALTVQHPRPILTGSSGRIPAIYTTGNPYKARITAPDGLLIDEFDGIPGDVGTSSSGGGGGTPDTAIQTGDVIWSYRTDVRAGWIRMNGRSIGSDVSGASERANVDCQPLFLFLWNADAALAVSGGRGSTAATDWAANKTIALPSGRGVSLVGLDDMGAAPAGLLERPGQLRRRPGARGDPRAGRHEPAGPAGDGAGRGRGQDRGVVVAPQLGRRPLRASP